MIDKAYKISLIKKIYIVFSIYGLLILNISAKGLTVTVFTYHLIIYWGVYLILEQKKNYFTKNEISITRLFIVVLFLLTFGFINYLKIAKIYILLPFVITSLFFLIFFRKKDFLQNLGVLFFSLFTFFKSVIFLFLNPIFTIITSFISWLSLTSIGFTPILNNNKILMESTGSRVLPGCSGLEQIIFALTFLFIFFNIYPIKNRKDIKNITITAVIIPLIINTLRVSLITILTTINKNYSDYLINILHQSTGSFIFNLLSIIPIFYLYIFYYKKSILKH